MKIFGNVFLKKKKTRTDRKGEKISRIKKTPQRTRYKQRTSKKIKQTKLVIPKVFKKRKNRKGMMTGRIYK